jgi:hypothetical protein
MLSHTITRLDESFSAARTYDKPATCRRLNSSLSLRSSAARLEDEEQFPAEG